VEFQRASAERRGGGLYMDAGGQPQFSMATGIRTPSQQT
jgi:hypothetical protein